MKDPPPFVILSFALQDCVPAYGATVIAPV